MSGLDKMVSQIMDEANHSVERKLAKANEVAGRLMADAKAEVDLKVGEMTRKLNAEVSEERQRGDSACDRYRRKALLEGKQAMIAEILEKAYQQILHMDASAYFAYVLKILEKHAWADSGEIYFSQRDLDRMPADFAAEIEQVAIVKGGSLVLSSESKEIDGGFVLVYGGIEENCSIAAMFRSGNQRLSDLVNQTIFA
ncbi:MAG: V-type ATP synthase subunit E [Lachnospiraceae bacterium]|nr:V-type ATP synthase subunit E [Lachnospiraceae bacterium]